MTPTDARHVLALARSGMSTRALHRAIGGPRTRAWALCYAARLERLAGDAPAPVATPPSEPEPAPPAPVAPALAPTPARDPMRDDPHYRAVYEAECRRMGIEP